MSATAQVAELNAPDLLRLVTAGSVDDGKSTLIGRLLYDTKSILQDQLDHIESVSERRGDERVDLALLTDGLRAEREQGITIDVAYRYFSTSRRKFIIADAPGHAQYTRNMVTGASTADLAVILVDARKGLLEQSRRHAFLASLLGIPHLVVAINKMDLVDYSEEVFEQIKADMTRWSAKLSVRDLTFIPISAVTGANVVDRSKDMDWYEGSPLLRHLETVHIASDRNLIDARFPVQWVIRPQSDELADYRGYAGVVAGGTLKAGDDVVVLPSGLTTRIERVETFDGPVEEASPPMSVTLHLQDEVDVSRGDMICRPHNQATVGTELDAMVAWASSAPMAVGKQYALKHTTRWVRATVVEMRYELNVNTLHRESNATELGLNGIGRVRLRTTAPLVYDPYERNRTTGAFILVDESTHDTVGAGMLLSPRADAPAVSTERGTRGAPGLFVTGTDTNVGKTLVSCALVGALREHGIRTVGMKPVASGSVETPNGLRNEDALALQAAGGVSDYRLVNPVAYQPPIAPHIAAAMRGEEISISAIESAFDTLREKAEFVVVEGAGGYRVPLSSDGGLTFAELPKRLGLGVLLVVGVRLGCLNHALLSAEAIRADGLELWGWVANCMDEGVEEIDAQIATLSAYLNAPLVGVIPRLGAGAERSPKEVASHLRLEPVLSRLGKRAEHAH